jgi:hypothetical protein
MPRDMNAAYAAGMARETIHNEDAGIPANEATTVTQANF